MEFTRTVWQVSAGPSDRSYASVLLRHGVALIGPGDAGPWRHGRNDEDFEGGFVRRFAEEAAQGDILLLRTGASKVAAVGLIAGDYEYTQAFDDVNGWDLQHARRVRWCPLPEEHDFGSPVFGANLQRFSRSLDPNVIAYAERFVNSPPTLWQTAPLPDLPMEEQPLGEIPTDLRAVVADVLDLVSLYESVERFGERPTEDELIGHLVIPLLRGLGWPPERIAVKWRYIDVCLFSALPRTPENCHIVIEAKRLGAGVEGALEQAKRYVQALGAPRDILVTDGVRYRMYSSANAFAPVAYANLARLKESATALFARLKRP